MTKPQFTQSIRFGVALAILLMGAFTLVVALLTSERYRWLIMENDQRALTELLGYEVQEDLKKHYRQEIRLSQNLQKLDTFRDAVRRGDSGAVTDLLDDQFRQYLVTSGKLPLAQLRVFDTAFTQLAESRRGPPPHAGEPACLSAVKRAAARRGLDRLKQISALCSHDTEVLTTTIVPVGGIRPFAYLQVISNPVPSLLGISAELRSPLEVSMPNGRVVARAGDWSTPAKILDRMPSRYVMHTPAGEPAFVVRVFRDGSALARRLATTRATLTLTTIGLTVLAMLLAFLVLRRTLLKPLRELTGQVQLVTEDRNHLGEPVRVSGSGEIRQLAQSFNDMSTQLAQLYRELEQMAFSDPLTRLPNRAWFYDSLKRLASLTDRGAPGFALLFLDLDRFKAINDSLGHKVGDEVLKLLAARIIGVLRGGDYLARFREEASDALARMGGDEFAVLLPTVDDRKGAERVAHKILAAIERPMHIGTHHLELGGSIGIALYPADAPDVETLIHRADLAMYHAKAQGGGHTHFEPALQDALTRN